MSRRTDSIAPEWFETLYKGDGDPWKFASSAYEQDKYAETLKALPEGFYPRALEVGCSIGVLTRLLAPRCGRLTAVDAAATPLIEARHRCKDLGNVEFAQMFVPGEWPEGEFDLILLSEVVYYLQLRDVDALGAKVAKGLSPHGVVILVHWTGETDYPLSGDEAAERLTAALGDLVEVRRSDQRRQYRLDVLVRKGLQAPQ